MNWKKLNLLEKYRYYLYLFLVGAALILLANTPLLKGLVGSAQRATVPLQETFYQGFKGIGNTFSTLVQIGKLRSINADLKLANAQLTADNLRLKHLEGENKSLKEQLGVRDTSLKIVSASHPVGKGIFGSKSILEIDKGGQDGLKIGDFVVIKNILLGSVINVTDHLSSIQLLTDPDTKIPAVTESGAQGLLIGSFGSEVVLTEVVQEDSLKPGDLVYTSGKDLYPKGLVVGEVSKVNKVNKELFQKATIKPLLKPEDLDLIYVARY